MLPMNHLELAASEHRRYLTRRWFFRDCGLGLGVAALHSLLGPRAMGGASEIGRAHV